MDTLDRQSLKWGYYICLDFSYGVESGLAGFGRPHRESCLSLIKSFRGNVPYFRRHRSFPKNCRSKYTDQAAESCFAVLCSYPVSAQLQLTVHFSLLS